MKTIRTAALVLISTLTTLMSSTVAIGAAGIPVPAVITGFAHSGDNLQFTVISNGCTHIDDFVLEHQTTDNGFSSVTLLRTRQDHCRRLPFEFTVSFKTPAAVGPGNAITITNTFHALGKRQADVKQ